MKYVFLSFIKLYQMVLSPFKVPCCRFTPTCSEYAKQAFLLHGVIKGAILTAKRLLKCHPWGQSGYDPVPQRIKKKGKR
ncbi:MAG: membrane protein insertion efficiency factor YidD [Alphaproteobacteria bacterium]|nr:membrane protein insertion efficiency factor YidD [Alphaproteobacteria bacterium]